MSEADVAPDDRADVPKVELRGVTKEYPNVVAVDDLSMSVRDGEFLCFLGPSGSGKTTTLNLISGIERPTRGDVLIDGEVVNDVSAKHRDIALLFQNLALFERLTVRKNLGFGPTATGASKAEVRERVREVADIVDIPEALLDRQVSSLTPSQRQRVALGRAIAPEPSILLLDEPMSNLDAEEAIDMRAEIKALQEDIGQTMIYVTHDQEEAMSLADRIMVIHLGELQQLASPQELYDRPVNRFVAGFIGSPSMNFLDVAMDVEGLVLADVTLPSDALERAFDDLDLATRDTGLELGIRPEDLTYGGDDTSYVLEATVEDLEMLGTETILYATLADGQEVTLLTDRRLRDDPGDAIQLGVDLADVYPIDGETEAVIY